MTAPQQVWRIGEERERRRERGECYSDDELLTMGGGGGDVQHQEVLELG